MMCYQENEEESEPFVKEDDDGAIRHLAMLHLNSAAKNRRSEKCTACGGAMKRTSPSFLSSLPEPSPKRVTLLPPSPASAAVSGGRGAAIGLKNWPISPLYRSFSTPIDCLGENPKKEEFRSFSAFGQFLNSPSPENPKKLPPSPPVKNTDFMPSLPSLHRSFSDPTAAIEFQSPEASTTPRGPVPPAQTIKSPTSSGEETPNTKRLKRMKERLKEMRQWWDEVLQEEDDNSVSQDNKEEAERSSAEESVWVEEKGGEGLVIHFKCPCKKGYEILLSGNNCYYKLM